MSGRYSWSFSDGIRDLSSDNAMEKPGAGFSLWEQSVENDLYIGSGARAISMKLGRTLLASKKGRVAFFGMLIINM